MTCTLQWQKNSSKAFNISFGNLELFPTIIWMKVQWDQITTIQLTNEICSHFFHQTGTKSTTILILSVTKYTRNIMTEAIVRSKEDCITTKVSDIHVRPLKAHCYSILNWTNECELAWRLLYSQTWTWTNIQLCILHTILLDWN